MKFISKHLVLFYILSFTWGFIGSFIGLLMLIPFAITKNVRVNRGRLYGVFSKKFGSGWGFEMGCFFFTSYDCATDEDLMLHEMGHGLQNICLGPFQLFVVSIPSMIRYWYRELHYYRKGKIPPTEYDSIWFEHWATSWGNKYLR